MLENDDLTIFVFCAGLLLQRLYLDFWTEITMTI
jgi:hypothetical protein